MSSLLFLTARIQIFVHLTLTKFDAMSGVEMFVQTVLVLGLKLALVAVDVVVQAAYMFLVVDQGGFSLIHSIASVALILH